MVPSPPRKGLFKITARCRELIRNFHLRTNLIPPHPCGKKMSNFNFPLYVDGFPGKSAYNIRAHPYLFVLEIRPVTRQSQKPSSRFNSSSSSSSRRRRGVGRIPSIGVKCRIKANWIYIYIYIYRARGKFSTKANIFDRGKYYNTNFNANLVYLRNSNFFFFFKRVKIRYKRIHRSTDNFLSSFSSFSLIILFFFPCNF